MTSIVSVVNLALLEMGNRVQINSLTDNTPAANAANAFYTPKIQALMRAANWDFCRKQFVLTLYKQAVDPTTGATSASPPAQPFQFEYLWPADALKARFILPYATASSTATVPITTAYNQSPQGVVLDTRIPFVVATDLDALGKPVKVILTNLQNAQLVYTADLSQTPDLWDPLFLSAATALLASYFINSLARDVAGMNAQIALAKGALDAARSANANEAMVTADHVPDWLMARFASAGGGMGNNTVNGSFVPNWDPIVFPSGLSY